MATVEDLHDVFERFCSFGSNRNLASMDASFGPGLTMDGAKFAKFARDSGLIDGRKVTTTEIDIIFNKVKAKTARRIDWNEFVKAVQMLAEKRYPNKRPQDALDSTLYDVCIKAKGPVSSGTAVKNDAVLDRLTDTHAYTGTHKLRFDADGHGRGMEGRDQPSKTDRLDKLVNRDGAGTAASTKRQQVLTQSEEQLDAIAQAPKKAIAGRRAANPVPSSKFGSSTSIKSSTPGSITTLNKSVTGSRTAVFDRLTDTSGYTGSHKHRFNADGTGRGAAGREIVSKGHSVGTYRGGDVKDLSQILRN
ncbi:p25-alpha-domain-containing protein [Zopfochytrium polystomum]|nr:p25-alpha-domain-containing protein [Zopfochytrium polystomum]